MRNTLTHWGIRGMKWGVRKARTASQEHNDLKSARKKHAKELTDQQLKKVIERARLEQQFKDINKSHAQKGGEYLGTILKTAGATLLSAYIVKVATTNLPKILETAVKAAKS